MTNPLLAIINYLRIKNLVRVESVPITTQRPSKAITPILFMQKGLDEFNDCGMYNEDLAQRIPIEKRKELDKYYAQGTLLIPSYPILLRLDGTASHLLQKHQGIIRDGKIIVDERNKWSNFSLRLGESQIYYGLEEISEGIQNIATVNLEGEIKPLKKDFMAQVCNWYGEFFRTL